MFLTIVFIPDLRRELQLVAWIRKCNDLYSLNQTVDFANLQAEHYPFLWFAFANYCLNIFYTDIIN